MIRYSLLIIKILFIILFSLTLKAEVPEQPAVLETEKPAQESAKVEESQPVIKDAEPQVEEAQPVIQDTAPQAEEVPSISEVKAPEEEVERVLSPEEKAMQDIEPSFVPKDEKVLEIFLLNKVVEDNESAIKKQKEEKIAVRNRLIKNYQQNLELYTKRALFDKEKTYDKALQDSILAYEKAIKHNPNNQVFTPDALYNYGWMSFDIDEKEYFRKLALYSDAKEKGIDTVEYPEENFSRTITAYKTLIKNYPKFRHIDNVYYLYALSLWYEGDFYKAVKYFQQLIAKYPKSKFVEEVWFRLGEYFYDMDEYDNAINAYNKVAKNKKSPLYDKAIYKIAWTYFQKDNYDLAIENFVKLLRLFYAKDSQITDSSMREEVIRYIVKSFSEKQNIGTQKSLSKNKEEQKELAEQEGALLAKSVYDYFVRLKKPAFTRDIMLEVAKQLLDESKLIGAINAFELAIKLAPKNPDNPRIDSQIVDVYQEAGELEKARKKNIDIIKRYGQRSRWVKSQKPSSDGAKFARDAVRDAMLSLAVYYHKTGKELMAEGKDENKGAAKLNFKKAADLYIRYIKEYPEKEDTYKAIFYFAESAYELRRFKTALDAYKLLKDYPLPMPGTFRADAVFNIVFTYRNVLEQAAKRNKFKTIDFDNLTSKSVGKEAEEIPKMGTDYLEAIDEFLSVAPNDERAPILYFHAAAIFYVYGQLEESQSRFFFIIDKYPQSAAASVAARLLIDEAVSKEDWVKVAELSKRFREQDLGGQGKDFARIEGNARFKIARAVFEEANNLFKADQINDAKDKFKESAALFGVLLQEDPQNPYADIMIFNTAQAIVKSGSSSDALPYYRKLYKEYPQSEYAASARFQEAFLLEKMLKFTDAAKAYDGIIKQDPKSESAGDAMLNKALLYEAAGDLKNASDSFIEFANKYPSREEAGVALLTAASLYKQMGQQAKQIAMLEQFIKKYNSVESKSSEVIEAMVSAADTYNDLAVKTSNVAQKKQYEKSRDTYYRSAVTRYNPEKDSAIAAFYVAKTQLYLEKPEQDSFKKLTINARTGKAQGEQLTVMMKKLQELSQKNENIIKAYAQPVWNAESMYRIGELYAHLAKTLVSAPCPRDVAAIDDYACDEYIVLLEDKAAVLEDKALDAYKQAYEIALSAYDSPPKMLDNILLALSKLKPGQYQKLGDVIVERHTYGLSGQGRMLSTSKMASILHPKEKDPDLITLEDETKEEEDAQKESEEKDTEEEVEEEQNEDEEDDNEEEDDDDDEDEDNE